METRAIKRKRKPETKEEAEKRPKVVELEEDKEANETALVPYKKSSSSSSDSSSSKPYFDRFAVTYDVNSLSSYNTFVCHLGDWKLPLTDYLKKTGFHKIFERVRSEYDNGV